MQADKARTQKVDNGVVPKTETERINEINWHKSVKCSLRRSFISMNCEWIELYEWKGMSKVEEQENWHLAFASIEAVDPCAYLKSRSRKSCKNI